MNLKRKYQPGGIVYTPYISSPIGAPQTSTSGGESKTKSSSDSPEKISGTMKKEIIALLKENGLPSDVSVFLDIADKFLTKSQSLSNFSLFGGQDDDYSMSDLIKIAQMVNDVKYNNGLRNEAVTHVKTEGAGSEVAITDGGLIYAYNSDGKIVKVKPSDYDPKKHQALSNSQLIYLRENNAGLAFQTGILNDLNNSIGMDNLTKQLREIVNSFGSDKVGGYATKDKSVIDGMQILMAAGPDGYYQFESEEELRDVKRALHYLYNSMPDNAKHLIRAKSAIEGGNPNDPDDISNLLWQVLQEHTSRTKTVKFDKTATDFDLTLSGKKSGSNAGDQLTHDTYPEALVSGSGLNPAQYINIMPQDTSVVLHAYAQDAAPVLKNEKDRMNVSSLQVVLTEGYGISTVVNAQSVTFGDQLMNPTDYKNIMVDTYTNMKRVWLPVTYAPDGRITPNFEAQRKLEQVQQYIANQNGAISDAWIENWLQENLPEATWNPKTKQVEFDERFAAPFLVLHGIASETRADFDTDSPYLHHMSRDEGERWRDDYERIRSEESVLGKLEHGKKEKSRGRHYYSGNIYIPISGPTTGSLIYNHQYFTKDTYTDITQKATANQTKHQLKTNF